MQWLPRGLSAFVLLVHKFSTFSFESNQFFFCFSERNTELMRDAIHTRYALLPYFYTLFREANVTGVPVVRPLWMEFPQDEATFSNDEAFMVGSGLLVQGVYTKVLKPLSTTSY